MFGSVALAFGILAVGLVLAGQNGVGPLAASPNLQVLGGDSYASVVDRAVESFGEVVETITRAIHELSTTVVDTFRSR